MDQAVGRICTKCGSTRFNSYDRCMDCRNERARNRKAKEAANGGRHTAKQWRDLLAASPRCAECGRTWAEIPPRKDPRYRYVWTKGHKIHVNDGGTADIENLQAECYQCNFGKNAGKLGPRKKISPMLSGT